MDTAKLVVEAQVRFPLLNLWIWIGRSTKFYYLVVDEEVTKIGKSKEEALWRFRQAVKKKLDANY